ncbi:MAG: NAD-dependent epimerase/dehydratase family protein, partial [Alphaproteobacteria bacterium]|nr:NAD-dependent epimerase/dehydratase family protein [Alphaproteobacteria bacterium]
TTDVYGYPVMPCDESHAVRDAGLPYNRSKGEGDRLSLAFSRRTGLPVTIVRPATIFGPRSKDWVVELSRLLVKGHALTLGGGHTPAGLVYVDDVATAMIALADLPAAAGEAYNVVDPSPVTWRAYFDRIADALGVARPQRDLGPRAAMMLAHLCEGAYRCAGIGTRPLFTRHVVLLMSRSQQYDSRKLRQALPDFPAIGVSRGLELTADWLASAEGARSWRNDARS